LRVFNDSLAVPFDLFSPVFSIFNERVKRKVDAPQGPSLSPKYTHAPLSSTLRQRIIASCKDCYPDAHNIFDKFQSEVETGYDKSRQMFGDLFVFDPPSSSFMSPFISAGCVTVRQLYALAKNTTYK